MGGSWSAESCSGGCVADHRGGDRLQGLVMYRTVKRARGGWSLPRLSPPSPPRVRARCLRRRLRAAASTASSNAPATSAAAASAAAASAPASASAERAPPHRRRQAARRAAAASSRSGSRATSSIFDPALAYDTISYAPTRLLFDQLLMYDAGDEARPGPRRGDADGVGRRPDLHVQAPQGREVLQARRHRCLREMTADDVVASLNRILDPNLKPNPSPVGACLLQHHRRRARTSSTAKRRPHRGCGRSIR